MPNTVDLEPALSPMTNGVSSKGLMETTVTFAEPGFVMDETVKLPNDVRTYDALFLPKLELVVPIAPIVEDEAEVVVLPPTDAVATSVLVKCEPLEWLRRGGATTPGSSPRAMLPLKEAGAL